MELLTAQDIVRAAGVSGLGELSSARNYAMVLPFTASHTVAASTKQSALKTLAGLAFVVDSIVGVAYQNTGGAGQKYLPLVAESTLDDGTNILEPHNAILVDIKYNSRNFTQAPVRWPNLVGTVQRPHIPLFPWILPPGSDVICSVQTQLVTTLIDWEIGLVGHYVSA